MPNQVVQQWTPFARRALKTGAAAALTYSGARRALAGWRRWKVGGRRVLIVSYHRVVEDFTGELQRSIPGLLISRETFRRQLEEAHAAGYALSTLEEALEVLAGRRVSRKDLCVVTFDDGYRDVYRHAFPVLRELGVPATIYLPALYVGTDRRFDHDRLFHLVTWMQRRRIRPPVDALPPQASTLLEQVLSGKVPPSFALDSFISAQPAAVMRSMITSLEKQLGGGPELRPVQGDVMGWDEARRMADAGVGFGAHTLHHTVLTHEPLVHVEKEIRESKAIIENELGRPVRDFAYCNGWYSDELIRILKKEGFRSAVTTEDLPNRMGEDLFALKRKVLWENFSIGMMGDYSSCLTGCYFDDVFGVLGMNHPVLGRRPQRSAAPSATVSTTDFRPEDRGDA